MIKRLAARWLLGVVGRGCAYRTRDYDGRRAAFCRWLAGLAWGLSR